jgi:hypothetical protein
VDAVVPTHAYLSPLTSSDPVRSVLLLKAENCKKQRKLSTGVGGNVFELLTAVCGVIKLIAGFLPSSYSSTLNMEAIRFSETSVDLYRST